jgi:ribosomal protein S21
VPRQNEAPERMVKRFTRKVRNDGILQEVFLRRSFEKPSMKARKKRIRAAATRRSYARELEKKR